MSKTLYGDAFIALKLKFIDGKCPNELHDVFDWAEEHGAKPYKQMPNPHPLNVHQRVLNALDRDERFVKEYLNYKGLPGRAVRIFRLYHVLYITDDLDKYSKKQWEEAMNVDYDFTIADTPAWKDLDFTKFDVVVMDYGFVDDEQSLLKIGQSGAKLGWCGALAWKYNEDAKKVFPKLKFLHNLEWAPLGDFGWLVDMLCGRV